MVKIKNGKVNLRGSGKELLSEISLGIGAVILDISKESDESPAIVAENVLRFINNAVRGEILSVLNCDAKESAAE